MAVKKNPALAYYKEGANRAAPAFNNSTSKLRLLRQVSEDLNTNLQRERSNEVRNDGQSAGSVIVGANGGGSVQLQYSLDTYDDLLIGMLYGADDAGTGREDGWQAGGFTPLADILATPGAVTFAVADHSFNGTFTRAPAAGERFLVRGFGNKNLDTVFVAAAGATTSKIVPENDTGSANLSAYAGVAADVVGAGITILPVKGYARNGTFERPFGLVRMYSDTELAGTASTTGLATVDWALFRGAIFTGLQLACAPGQAGWTGTFSVLLADEWNITDASSNANISGFDIDNWDEVQPVNTNPLANAIQSVLMVRLRKNNGAITTATRVEPLSFNINLSNGATEISATRNRGAIAIIQGSFTGAVAMSLLYIDGAFHQGMLNDDFYEVEIAVGDSEGRAQLLRFAKCRYTSARPNPGVNQAVAQSLAFEAEPGGNPFAFTGFTNGGNGTAKVFECVKFYVGAA